jgi:hypothetical protein
VILSPSTKLSDAIFSDPSLIPVINRFGIFLGVGDATVGEICLRQGLDPDFFLAVVNTFLNEDYFPADVASTLPADKVVEYLLLTDRYYEAAMIPNIERHFRTLMARSPRDNNLPLLWDFFAEMRTELLTCIADDRKRRFPLIVRLFEGGVQTVDGQDALDAMPEAVARRSVGDKLADLEAFFVMHLRGEYDRNLCMAVVSAIFTLSKDIRQNNRIRERILSPLARLLISNR